MRVLVLTNLWPAPERPGFGTMIRSQVESLAGVGVQAEVQVIQGKRGRGAYVGAARELRKRVAGGGFDLVHAHYGYCGWVALLQTRVPVVMSFMGDDVLGSRTATGGLEPRSRVVSRLNGMLSPRYAAVIVKTEAMAAALPRKDVDVIPNGVDRDRFAPGDRAEARRRLGLEPDVAHVLFAAPPAVPTKRHSLAALAVERLAERRPARLHVIHGRPQEELVTWMRACDALLLPSASEGSPNVVKEALACNLPVVATPAGDVRELLGRCEGNRVVEAPVRLPPEERARWAERLAEALDEVIVAGRTRCRDAIDDLDLNAVAARVLAVYERVNGAR